MSTRVFSIFLFTLLLACSGPTGEEGAPSASFKSEFRAIWKNASDYTHEVLDSMPEEELDLVAAEGSMSFRDHLLHIEGNIHRLTDRYILRKKEAKPPEKNTLADKKELEQRLRIAFNKVREALDGLSEAELQDSTELFGRMSVPRSRVFLLMRDHMTHHRGQMIIALRQAGKEPPRFRGW